MIRPGGKRIGADINVSSFTAESGDVSIHGIERENICGAVGAGGVRFGAADGDQPEFTAPAFSMVTQFLGRQVRLEWTAPSKHFCFTARDPSAVWVVEKVDLKPSQGFSIPGRADTQNVFVLAGSALAGGESRGMGTMLHITAGSTPQIVAEGEGATLLRFTRALSQR